MTDTPIGDQVASEMILPPQIITAPAEPADLDDTGDAEPPADSDPEPVMNDDADDDLSDVPEGEDDGDTELDDDPADDQADDAAAGSDESA